MIKTASWVLADKPAGFHTHAPEDHAIRVNPRRNAHAILERQLGARLAPAHRLDRAASGLLLFTHESPHRASLQKQFASHAVQKTYFVLVRGEPQGRCEFREPLASESGSLLEAETIADPCFSFPLPIPHPRGGDRRFTVLEARPRTGRFHQLRRHFAAGGFPLIGDTQHGDRKLNREFTALTGCEGLFLRCMELEFTCPETGARVKTRARWSRVWHKLFDRAGACALVARV